MADYRYKTSTNRRYAYNARWLDWTSDTHTYDLPPDPQHDDIVTFHNLDQTQNPIAIEAAHPHLVQSVYVEAYDKSVLFMSPLGVVTYRFDEFAYNGVWRAVDSHLISPLIEIFQWQVGWGEWRVTGPNRQILMSISAGGQTLESTVPDVLYDIAVSATCTVALPANNTDVEWNWLVDVSGGSKLGQDSYDWVSSPRAATGRKSTNANMIWLSTAAGQTLDVYTQDLAGTGTTARESITLSVGIA